MFETKVSDFIGFNADIPDNAVGIEIEVEGEIQPFPTAPAGWTSHEDGSLKAMYQKEYVSRPIPITEVDINLTTLKNKLVKYEAVIMDSIRAGVHIHINVLNYTLEQVLKIAYTYLAMERVLVKFCGPNREGNLFCLRASDADYLLYCIRLAVTSEDFHILSTDSIRYGSLNLSSIFKHGTLEFRAMKTEPDLSKIEDWAKILHKIKLYGSKLETPSKIADEISFYSPDLWVKKVLGDKLYDLVKYKGMDQDIMRDLRNIQYILYS